MKIRRLFEWEPQTRQYDITLEIEQEDGKVLEVPASIEYNWSRPRPATHLDPAEGGVEVENIIIGGKRYNSTEELQALGVITQDGYYDGIIDQYIDNIYNAEWERSELARYGDIP